MKKTLATKMNNNAPRGAFSTEAWNNRRKFQLQKPRNRQWYKEKV